VKLTITALVASLALVGCVGENDGSGGAHLEGLRPAKPSLDDPKLPTPTLTPGVSFLVQDGLVLGINGEVNQSGMENLSAETISQPFPIDGICTGCDLVVIRDARNANDLLVIDELGKFLCHIWVDDNGAVESTSCR
jgi:hypothetical protein